MTLVIGLHRAQPHCPDMTVFRQPCHDPVICTARPARSGAAHEPSGHLRPSDPPAELAERGAPLAAAGGTGQPACAAVGGRGRELRPRTAAGPSGLAAHVAAAGGCPEPHRGARAGCAGGSGAGAAGVLRAARAQSVDAAAGRANRRQGVLLHLARAACLLPGRAGLPDHRIVHRGAAARAAARALGAGGHRSAGPVAVAAGADRHAGRVRPRTRRP